MTGARSMIRTLHELSALELDRADPRYPKWATMCRHRLLRLPVLNAVLITPGEQDIHVAAAIEAIAEATGQQRLMLRSDGGTETRRYPRGGNSFPLDELRFKVPALLSQGRAVILLEPTNRYTNRMTVLLRMDRPEVGQAGQFTIEALGPGYDVADLPAAVLALRLQSQPQTLAGLATANHGGLTCGSAKTNLQPPNKLANVNT